MGDDSDSGEGTAVFVHRLRNAETISADIALRLAGMLFITPIGKFPLSRKKTLEMINRGGAKVAFRDFQRLSFRVNRIKRLIRVTCPLNVQATAKALSRTKSNWV
jgi:hypothetical protein